MKVVFSSSAKTDLAELVRFIALDKPQAARKWAENLRESVSKLSNFPHFGRVVPEYADKNIREIIKGQYGVFYKIDDEKQTIVVVAVHHGKKPLP